MIASKSLPQNYNTHTYTHTRHSMKQMLISTAIRLVKCYQLSKQCLTQIGRADSFKADACLMDMKMVSCLKQKSSPMFLKLNRACLRMDL